MVVCRLLNDVTNVRNKCYLMTWAMLSNH